MIELLNFVFSSFWTFIGCIILLSMTGKIVAAIGAVIIASFASKS